jgi:hypothetical protein
VRKLKIPAKNGRTPLQAPLKNTILFSDQTEKENKEMLTMEQIYRIKNMRKFEGKSLRKISEITLKILTV